MTIKKTAVRHARNLRSAKLGLTFAESQKVGRFAAQEFTGGATVEYILAVFGDRSPESPLRDRVRNAGWGLEFGIEDKLQYDPYMVMVPKIGSSL